LDSTTSLLKIYIMGDEPVPTQPTDQEVAQCVTEDTKAEKTSDNKRKRSSRKTRSQRRKEKMQRLRLEQMKESGGETAKYDDRVIVRDNPNLVKYYRLQSFITAEEFDKFMEGLKTTLPASFRINTFDYGQAKFLRKLVQGPEFCDFLKTKPQDESPCAPCEGNMSVLEPLLWYPRKLAWQMNVTRVDLKRSPILQKLHKFIMAETDNGFISRQESVSMIPPLVLDIKRGHNILDMCAAPGSKTAQLLEYLKFDLHDTGVLPKSASPIFEDGLVVANDVDNKRCYMLVHQSNRLNSPNCVIINEDASRLPKMMTFNKDGEEYFELKFDRILCDAPCSGDGTVRKNPDVWRKWTTGNANNFHGLQSKILKRGVELLKEGGIIVYSTCSMNPVEDEAVVAAILRMAKGGVILEDCSERLKGLNSRPGVSNWVVMNRDMNIVNGPEEVKPEQASQIHASLFPPNADEAKQFNLDRCVRVLPHIQNTGAFFVAVLRKLKSTLPWEEEATNGGTAGEDGSQPKQQATKQANPKKRRYGGFREDPFVFMEPDDADWCKIRDFYGFANDFPVDQLVHRCLSGKKRSIHLVSKATRNFMIANREESGRKEFVKLINGGMRLFAKAETEAGFRICQDGVNEIVPYVKSDLKVPITKDDLRQLLERKSVPMNDLTSGSHLRERLKQGSCILIYRHDEKCDGDGDSDDDGEIEMPLVAWRGEHAVTLYVSTTFRVHLHALIESSIVGLKVGEVPAADSVPVDETTDCGLLGDQQQEQIKS